MTDTINIPIEILGVIIWIGFALFCAFVWWITRLILKWKYRKENDKSRLGEERRADKKAGAGVVQGKTEINLPIQTGSSVVDGKADSSPRKTRRKLFLFRRRK